jgi:hypothetical protein
MATYMLRASPTRDPQGQGFTEAGGRFQRHGEKVQSNREGRILDTRRV